MERCYLAAVVLSFLIGIPIALAGKCWVSNRISNTIFSYEKFWYFFVETCLNVNINLLKTASFRI